MVKVFTNTKTFKFSSIEVFDGKIFIQMAPSVIAKMHAGVIKLDNKVYATNNLTIVSSESDIDVLLEQELQSTKNTTVNHDETIKKLKKIISSYEGKFQFGLTQHELETFAFAKASLDKYKMLKRLKLEIIKEESDD